MRFIKAELMALVAVAEEFAKRLNFDRLPNVAVAQRPSVDAFHIEGAPTFITERIDLYRNFSAFTPNRRA